MAYIRWDLPATSTGYRSRSLFYLRFLNNMRFDKKVKMAAMKDAPETPATKPPGICFNHQKGLCTRGKK
jgi:hypothetical protein